MDENNVSFNEVEARYIPARDICLLDDALVKRKLPKLKWLEAGLMQGILARHNAKLMKIMLP